MEYVEQAPPPALAGWVKLRWTLDVRGEATIGVVHRATPDGCVEIIQRLRGASSWGRAQPTRFVAGLIDRPAELNLSGDARFVGWRLWPWTWHRLGGRPCTGFRNDWSAWSQAGLSKQARAALMDLSAVDEPGLLAALASDEADEVLAMGRAVLASATVAELAARSGRSLRSVQRWFEHNVGCPPRTYLRLLRFQDTLLALQTEPASLVEQAARRGYADQSHMAREFTALSGVAATSARKKARGPFL